ncbi:class I SAM-dependent methyltransferase [Streptomyces sp. BE230]|uniref:class I SAM-dependent methyltransferase n=1 Tax=Streptomyces sp. BE230 TaxID=3002526 RepID=UPI002ED22D20|nr:class I SAM-dependent methyltransferase [Streptomyces sp. BE230]
MTEAQAWDTYSKQKPDRRPTNATGETTWFNWTQYPDHDPGAELLSVGPGASVLDLGCGKGGNLAHIATLGARAVGVDVSLAQVKAAESRWPHVGMALHRTEAIRFLKESGERFDAVFSVFGAAWFTDPTALLPAIRQRLRPGGASPFPNGPRSRAATAARPRTSTGPRTRTRTRLS